MNKKTFMYSSGELIMIVLLVATLVVVSFGYFVNVKDTISKSDTLIKESYYISVDYFNKDSCVKGFCNASGFTCLDNDTNPFLYKNCYCTMNGYICKA